MHHDTPIVIAGPVLIAMNPYKLVKKNGLGIYDQKYVDAYSGKVCLVLCTYFALAAEATLHALRSFCTRRLPTRLLSLKMRTLRC